MAGSLYTQIQVEPLAGESVNPHRRPTVQSGLGVRAAARRDVPEGTDQQFRLTSLGRQDSEYSSDWAVRYSEESESQPEEGGIDGRMAR